MLYKQREAIHTSSSLMLLFLKLAISVRRPGPTASGYITGNGIVFYLTMYLGFLLKGGRNLVGEFISQGIYVL